MTLTEVEKEKARQRTKEWRAVPGNVERERATKQAWKDAHPEEWRAQKAAASARYAEKNREELKAKRNTLRVELRAEAIAAYGGRCNCPGCHVHHAELLTIDHVNGGAHHRRNRRSTRDVYRWLKKHNYPLEFQALCGSCNLAKSDQDACPLAGEEH